MLCGINLAQPAVVLWWADGDLQTPDAGAKWGGSSRQFGTLQETIRFVKTELTNSERSTAIVNFDSAPNTLDLATLRYANAPASFNTH
jgi:hypothetical protein